MKIIYITIFTFLTNLLFCQEFQQVQKILSPSRGLMPFENRRPEDKFGNSVAIYEDWAVVGSPQDDLQKDGYLYEDDKGAIFIFKKENEKWIQFKKIRPILPIANSFFGSLVSIYENTIIVSGGGKIYIFDKDSGGINNWGEIKIINTLSSEIKLISNYIFVSNKNDSNSKGSVKIFERDFGGINNWGNLKIIQAFDGNSNDFFGENIGISNDILAVSAYGQDYDQTGQNFVSNSGATYLFGKDIGGINNWGLLKKIVSPYRYSDDNFGISINFNGDDLLVGASNFDYDQNNQNYVYNSGAIFIFSKNYNGNNNFGLKKIVTKNTRLYNDFFGSKFYVNNNFYISKGLIYEHVNYEINWNSSQNLLIGNNDTISTYYYDLEISNNYLIIGDPYNDTASDYDTELKDMGAAFFYDLNFSPTEKCKLNEKKCSSGPPITVHTQMFGGSVKISGNYLAVSSVYDLSNEDNTRYKYSRPAVFIHKNINGVWTFIKKIVSPTWPKNSNSFGNHFALDGQHLVITDENSDYFYNTNSRYYMPGAVFLYEMNEGGDDNWGLKKAIAPDDINEVAQFGSSIDIDGENIVVGSNYDYLVNNTFAAFGAVYIFNKNQGGIGNWGQVKKVVANDRQASDFFGQKVAINGNDIVVSSLQDDEDANGMNTLNDAGSAYIFSKDQGGINNWGQVKKISASIRIANDNFGIDLAMNGEFIIVRAPKQKSYFLFKRNFGGPNNWGEVQKLNTDVSYDYVYSSTTLSISSNKVIIGSNLHKGLENPNGEGAAFIFNLNSNGPTYLTNMQTITYSDHTSYGNFGNSVDIDNDNIIVGSWRNQTDLNNENRLYLGGAAYIFKQCGNPNISYSNSISVKKQLENTLYFDSNCNLIANVSTNQMPPNGPIGHSVSKLWVENIIPNNIVRRHFEIFPTTNSSTAIGTITLYLSQDDFDAFNNLNLFKLPINGNDLIGKSNLRIKKFIGRSSDNSGSFNSYLGSLTIINPDDDKIIWNSTENRWEITFETIGFGGFFINHRFNNPCIIGENILTLKSGNWDDPTVWSCGSVPLITDNVEIQTGHIISINTNTYTVKSITLNGTVQFEGNGTIEINP